jgi:hypothetical protein
MRLCEFCVTLLITASAAAAATAESLLTPQRPALGDLLPSVARVRVD